MTRVTLHGGVCPCCAKRFKAEPPQGLEPGSPFGPNLRAFVIYLRSVQGIPLARLSDVLKDLFGLDISEGALVEYSLRQPRALRGADEPDQGAASGRHGARLRRNRHEGRQSQLVALGVPPWRQRRLRGRRPSLEGGRAGVPGRMAARLLDLGSPRQPDGLGQARASGLSGPSDPRRPIRHRRGRRRVRAGA